MLLAGTTFAAENHAHWGYSGENGPENWAKLTPEYGACGTGKNQTPINLAGFVEADLKPLKFAYQAGTSQIVNNGHTIQINYAPGSTVTINKVAYELKQFHFHAPSENQIKGKSYPLEGHFVHADKDGNLAVVAVMFKQGKADAALAKLWSQLPEHEGEPVALNTKLSAMSLLPKQKDYYRFSGSLTTPPCTEGVRWIVMKQPVSASAAQIDAFKKIMEHDNNRPLQALNARLILQ